MAGRADIRRGDVFWVAPDGAPGEGVAHPHVVVQEDVLNRSRIETVVVCALTTNLRRAAEPGNVRLDPGEADLPRPSVIVVAQVSTVPKGRLGAYIGTLSAGRVEEALAGLAFQQTFRRRGDAPGPDTADDGAGR